jgi:DNA topoisomerase-1
LTYLTCYFNPFQDDDEADTVGCCTLKVDNVTCVPPNKLQFDFLGKDSIRYFNTVEVELPVYSAIEEFRAGISHDFPQPIHFFMS